MHKLLLIIMLAVWPVSVNVHAQETTNFTEMTLEQLQSVDQTTLSKKERKTFKKALKKKKKAAAKAVKAAAKAKKKRLKKYNKIYKYTKITGSDFDKYISVTGPDPNYMASGIFGALLSTESVGWNLRSWVYPSGKSNHQLFVSKNYRDKWRFYNVAKFRRGGKAEFASINTEVTGCDGSQYGQECDKQETFGATIPLSMLLNAFKTGQGIDVQFQAKSGDTLTQEVPAHYIQAYVKKMADELNIIPKDILAEGTAIIENGSAAGL